MSDQARLWMSRFLTLLPDQYEHLREPMKSHTTKQLACPNCGATHSGPLPGWGAMLGSDLLAVLIALPLLALGFFGYWLAYVVAFVAFIAIFWPRKSGTLRCNECGQHFRARSEE